MIKKTTQWYIEKAKNTHGDKYDYSLVEYKGWNDKIKIICPYHGEFLQKPQNHILRGCRRCSDKIHNKVDKERFLEKAISKHKDKFDYSLVKDFNNRYELIDIICKKHGEYKMTPETHLRTMGCEKCAKEVMSKTTRKTPEQNIEIIKKVWGDTFKYDKTKEADKDSKLTVTCKKHGDFSKTIDNLIKGQGCPKCIVRVFNVGTKDNFVKKANKYHKNKYDYSLVEYVRSRYKVKILCKEHGIFEQTPNNHLKAGCPKCDRDKQKENPVGWTYTNWIKAGKTSKNFDCFKVYIIRCWNDEEDFYKIGKTFTTVKTRFRCKERIPYNYETIKIIISEDAKYICELEQKLKNKNKKFKYIPKNTFNGMYECFSNYKL